MKQKLFIFMLLLGIAAGAQAVSLKIGDFTLEVGSDYTEWSGMSCLWEGTITFTDANHVTFENVTLNFNTGNNIAISTDIPGLTITLVGENKIQGAGTKTGLYFSQYMTITGDGSLDIVASENGIEGAGSNSLTITDAHVKAKGGTYGIRLGGSGKRLYVKGNGVFEAYGGTKCLQGVKSLGEGSLVTAPAGAKFSTTALSVVDASNNPISNEWVTIIKGIAINETNFPDENFRNWVLDQDYGADGVLKGEEIEQVKVIDVSSRRITNLKGIEFFTALTELYCFDNLLTSLDVSKNTALTQLSCAINQLTALDVSKNTALQTLLCGGNQLTALNVLKNTALTDLACDNNQLTALDVSKNTLLNNLQCADNQLTALDISKNEALWQLICNDNQLTSLDVSKNTLLSNLQCTDNQLTSLDVSKNKRLLTILCYGNAIRGEGMATLVNSLPAEPVDGCDNCKVLKVYKDETDGNEMTTLQVAVAKDKGWNVQTYDGSYYEGISVVSIDETNFPDENFRNWLLAQDYGKDGGLTENEIAGVTEMSVSEKDIENLQGIEFFTALTYLNCSYNHLTTLDVSNNTALIYLHCYGNAISGEGMDALVNSLSPTDDVHALKVLYVHSFDEEDRSYTINRMTTQQVAAAKKKGWKVVKILEDGFLDYEGVLEGDANGDGEVNVADAVYVSVRIGSDYDANKEADVNGDGKIDAEDVVFIVYRIL